MKWTIEYVESGDLFKVVSEGIYRVDDSRELLAGLFAHHSWHAGAGILFDGRRVDFSSSNYLIMSGTTANFALFREQIDNGKIASLITSPLGYGISRQFKTLLEARSTAQVEIFTDENAALCWLTEKDSDEKPLEVFEYETGAKYKTSDEQ